MNRTAAARSAAAVLAALALVSCAQVAADPTATPEAPSPSASASSTPPAAPSAAPSATPSSDTGEAGGFESRDGAVRFELPDGWTVDDRSAMGEASEMYNRGPGWLNELVVLDEDGDQMLWYREDYGNDYVDCREERADAVEIVVEPFAPEVAAELERSGGRAVVISEVAEASNWEATAARGAWSVAMGLAVRTGSAEEGCSDLSDVLWTGTRAAWIDAVGDTEDAASGMPDTTIDFADEPSARAWLDSAEHDAIVDVLASLELSAAPILDAAPR